MKVTATNWIVFVTPDGVKWRFKFPQDSTYQNHVLKLVAALHSFGEDVFGEGLGLLRVSPQESTRKNEIITIMFVRLSADLYMIISEPEITAKLLEVEESSNVPDLLRDQTRSILIGSLIMIYSQFWGSDIHAGLQEDVDAMFDENLKRIGAEGRAFAQQGECTFSQLSLSELILLHYYIQLAIEANPKFHGVSQWALVASKDGVPLHFYWNLEYGLACSLAAMVSAIYWFSRQLFDLRPREMTFGSTNFIKMSIFSGEEVFLAAAGADKLLFHDFSFQQSLFRLKPEVLEDITPELRHFMIKIVTDAQAKLLEERPLVEIIDHYRSMAAGQGMSLNVGDVDLRKPFLECLSLVRSISNPSLLDVTEIAERMPFRYKILVLGSSMRIKKFFLESILSAEFRQQQVGDMTIEILKTRYVFMNKTVILEFWFIDAKTLTKTELRILNSAITFNTNHVVIPYSFHESHVFPPLTKYIDVVTRNTGKSFVNTVLLLLDIPKDEKSLKRILSSFYQVKSKIKQKHALLCLPMRDVTSESFDFLFEIIMAQQVFELYWFL